MDFVHYTATSSGPCAGRNCYCFYGSNPLDYDMSSIEDADSVDLSPIEQINTTEMDVDDSVTEDTWAFSVNNIVFYHPRVLLAYFRFVDLQNEICSWEDMVHIPPIHPHTAAAMKNHTSIREPPEEFLHEIRDLVSYIDRHTDLSCGINPYQE